MSTTVLRAEILYREQQAVRLEKIVYNELTALEWLQEHESIASQERIILQKLRRLDELQEEIDGRIAALKELGDYTPVRVANPKKAKGPKTNRTGNYTYIRQRKKVDPRTTERWLTACDFMENGNGLITAADVMALFGISNAAVCQEFKKWTNAGMITFVGKQGCKNLYCRTEDEDFQIAKMQADEERKAAEKRAHRKPKPSPHWDKISAFMDEGDGSFTHKQLRDLLDLSVAAATSRIAHWKRRGKISSHGTNNQRHFRKLVENDSQHGIMV